MPAPIHDEIQSGRDNSQCIGYYLGEERSSPVAIEEKSKAVPMILVSGAAGKTGRAVIRALVGCGNAIRALVHTPAQVGSLQRLGVRDVTVGDMRHAATWMAALRDVRAVYHICPNMIPDELSIGQLALLESGSAAISHFVYHSVLHPQIEAMPHHWQKLRMEEQLFESGLSYTILQPAAYMQNVLAGWDEITGQGIYRVPYPAETRLGMVDLEDVAEAAAVVLMEPGHEGATYELSGPEVLTQLEVAAILARRLGRPVRAEAIALDVWEQQVRATGLGNYQLQTLVKMFQYYERYGFWGNARVLEGLLGREPTSFSAFVTRVQQIRER